MTTENRWPLYYFTMSNPEDRWREGLPLLLRRVADEIEEQRISSTDIQGVTISQDSATDDDSWVISVYFAPDPSE